MGSNNDLPTKIAPVVTSVTCPAADEKKFLSVGGVVSFTVGCFLVFPSHFSLADTFNFKTVHVWKSP